jgi:hypothetical protein
MTEFLPRGKTRQPSRSHELMGEYRFRIHYFRRAPVTPGRKFSFLLSAITYGRGPTDRATFARQSTPGRRCAFEHHPFAAFLSGAGTLPHSDAPVRCKLKSTHIPVPGRAMLWCYSR